MTYMNNTNQDVSLFHNLIVVAIENNGEFGEDLSDIFVLEKTPDGSSVDYVLNFA